MKTLRTLLAAALGALLVPAGTASAGILTMLGDVHIVPTTWTSGLSIVRDVESHNGVHRKDLAYDKAVKAHPNGSQVLFDRGLGVNLAEVLNIGRHDDGLDVDQGKPSIVAPRKEVGERAVVSFSRVPIPDIGRKELQEPRPGFPTGAADYLRNDK